jgi:DNA-binding transcriptional LysR family regulator
MNFKQLEAFYWLTKMQSYQRVADHLCLTQPAVSARISGLENDLGVKLVDRKSSEFRLTDQGHEVTEYAETFLNLREAMTGRLMMREKRRFTIGLVEMVAVTWGHPLRQKISAMDSDLIVDFNCGSNLDQRNQLRSGSLDMAFVTGEAELPQIAKSFSVHYAVGWAARPDVVGEITRPKTPEEIREMPLIFYPRTSPLFRPVAEYVEETRRRPNARHTGNSLATIAELVRCGYGVAAMPLAPLERDIAQGTLVEVPTTVKIAPLDIRCVYLNKARKKVTNEIFELARAAAREWCAANPRYTSFHEG